MNQRNWVLVLAFISIWISACVQTEIIPEFVTPKLAVDPASVSLILGQTFQVTGVYTNEFAEDQSASIEWSSAATDIATVNASGLVSALAAGQTWIFARVPSGLSDSVLVTVTGQANMVAEVIISTTSTVLEVGAMRQLTATAYNAANQEIPTAGIMWFSSNPDIASVGPDGIVTGQVAGTASVTASLDGVNSLPLVFEVIPAGGISRTGTFSGNMGYSVVGTATLQQVGATVRLILESDFQASNGPQLGVYLAKNATGSLNTQNSLKLSNLQSNSGMQSYDVPTGVALNDYDYVVIYCIPFTVRFGTAQLNN